MEQKEKLTVKGRMKTFFARLIEKLDKQMEAKAKAGSCCCNSETKKDKTCCS